MGREFITFGSTEIEKQNYHYHKSSVLIFDVNIDRIVVSNKVPFSKKSIKYFIGYENECEKVMLLCIKLPKMTAYRRDFHETKYMSFLTKDNELLEKYNEI